MGAPVGHEAANKMKTTFFLLSISLIAAACGSNEASIVTGQPNTGGNADSTAVATGGSAQLAAPDGGASGAPMNTGGNPSVSTAAGGTAPSTCVIGTVNCACKADNTCAIGGQCFLGTCLPKALDGTGGASSKGGTSSGISATGGKTAVSTSSTTGGAMQTGGSKATGGSQATGGSSNKATGGTPGTGGTSALNTGGSPTQTTGGQQSTGGAFSDTYTVRPFVNHCDRETETAISCTCTCYPITGGLRTGPGTIGLYGSYSTLIGCACDTTGCSQSEPATMVLTCQIPSCQMLAAEIVTMNGTCPAGNKDTYGNCTDTITPNRLCIKSLATLSACSAYISLLAVTSSSSSTICTQ